MMNPIFSKMSGAVVASALLLTLVAAAGGTAAEAEVETTGDPAPVGQTATPGQPGTTVTDNNSISLVAP
jgi:hypothetical protein